MKIAFDDAKIELIKEHARLEREKDWPGALATMSSEPVYEYFPYRLRVSGAEPIQVMWERTLVLPCLDYSTGRRVLSLTRYITEDSVADLVQNEFGGNEGALVYSTFLCIFHFAGDKIAKETIHLDYNMIPYMDDVLQDPSFLSLPGVERF